MTSRFAPLIALVRMIPMPWALLLSASALTLLETAAALWLPMLTRDLVDGATIGLPRMGSFQSGLGLLCAVLVAQAICSGVGLYLMSKAGEQMTAFLRRRLLGKLLRLPMAFHDEAESGELVSRTLSDTAAVESLLTDQVISFFAGLVSIVGAITILWFLDWRLTLVLFSSVLVGLLLILPVTAKLQAVGRDIQDQQASFSGRLTAVLGDIRLLKATCAEPQEEGRAAVSIDGLLRLGLREARVLAILGPVVTLAMTGALVIILGYGGARVASGALAVGTLVAFILYLFQVVLPMVQFSAFFAALSKAAGAAEHLSKLLQEANEPEVAEGLPIDAGQGLRLSAVDFAYQPGQSVLTDFDLEIPVGQVTALVGPSGSGKTTVFSLLERFYKPQSGTIEYGGVVIDELPLEQWRRRIGYVPQEAPILSGSVRDNLCWGLATPPDEQKLQEVLRAARADGFVGRLEDGLNTTVGERGVKLSGGQRQRLAIARAFLADPEILMLDEATASLDAESEDAVRGALDELMRGRTTLIIAHRLATVINAEQIAVVVDGRVTGVGSHERLLAEHDVYRGLVERQLMDGVRAAA